MTKRIRPRWMIRLGTIALFGGLFGCMAVAGSLCFFQFAPPEQTCLSCHEIQAPYDRWAGSTHRTVSCKKCHGGTLTSGIHGLEENIKRLVAHVRDTDHADMRLSEDQVVAINTKCGQCHAREYAHWLSGGHGINYPAIFLDEKHNKTEQIAEDCLRCHGMFFEGSVGEVVEPLDIKGPWRLKDASLANRPAIPCLACHQVHVAGHPFAKSTEHGGEKGEKDAAAAPECREAVCLYSRRERTHFAAADLPQPKIEDHGRPVLVSTDPRQRVCVQCHAPNAYGEAGSGDDRTPRGVHEGLSCAACHAPHSNDARASCVQCHPKFSHCGLDVTQMDTSFRSSQSPHNIHSVSCTDCHTKGVPTKPSEKADADKESANK
jgi:hypothetical protein